MLMLLLGLTSQPPGGRPTTETQTCRGQHAVGRYAIGVDIETMNFGSKSY